MLNELAIDSMRVRIPVGEVSIIDAVLGTNVLRVHEKTGEVLQTSIEKQVYKTHQGVNFSCSIQLIQTGRSVQKCLLLSVHSKMLLNDYLEGINANNLRRVYDFIQSMGVVSFSYDTFLAARVTDVDIKSDFTATSISVKDAMEALVSAYKNRSKINTGYMAHYSRGDKTYTGHSFNSRKTSSWRTSPYMKVYSKYEDSQSLDHRAFFIENNIILPKNLWRHEFTLKDSQHMANFGIENSVLGIATATAEKLREARLHCTNALFTSMPKQKEQREGLAPLELLQIELLLLGIESGLTLEQVIRRITSQMSADNASKYRVKLTIIFETHIAKLPQGKKSISREAIFKALGMV